MFWHDTLEGYKEYLDRGLTFLALGADYEFIQIASADVLNRMRAAVETSEVSKTSEA
jgi:hypothetical protein